MRGLAVAGVALAALAGAAACFETPRDACAIRCAAGGAPGSGACPEGLACGTDDFCHAAGEPATCVPGGADAAVDVDAGGGQADAGPGCVTGGFALAGGNHQMTEYLPATQRLVLAGNAASGVWDSPIVDLGETRSLARLTWVTARPTGVPLPGGRAVESGYEAGNADMSANRLLLRLDERAGAVFADASGAGNAGACTMCPTLGQLGPMGGAAVFDGVNDRIEVADDPELEPADAYTLEVWGRVDGQSLGASTGMFVTKGVGAGGPPFASYSLEVDHNVMPVQRLKCYGTFGMSSITVFGTSLWPQGSAPFHAACVYDGAALAIYVNGELENSMAITGSVGYGLVVDELLVGAWGGSQRLVGLVDEVAVYGAALGGAALRDRWLRGALGLEWQVRSCDDPACAGEIFVGPDGTAATGYHGGCAEPGFPPALALNDLDCDGDGAPDDGADLAVPPGRWVQVRAYLDRPVGTAFTPEVLSVGVCPASAR